MNEGRRKNCCWWDKYKTEEIETKERTPTANDRDDECAGVKCIGVYVSVCECMGI